MPRLEMLVCSEFLVATVAAFAQVAPPTLAPPTPKHPVVDTYYDVKVTDDYRWLENGDDAQVKAWVAAQNSYTHSYADAQPQRAALLEFFKRSVNQAHVEYGGFQYTGGKLFAFKFDPKNPGGLLVWFASPDDKSSEHLILNLGSFIAGKKFQADWFVPSPDGKLVAVSLSEGGSEDGSLYVIDTTTGKQVGDVVPRVQFATGGGSAAWTGDSRGLYYTRYPQGNERPPADANFYQQVYFHKLGSPPASDRYVLGKDFPRVAETTLSTSKDRKELLVSVANGDGGEYEHFLSDISADMSKTGAPTQQITHFADKIALVMFGSDDSLWLLTRKNSDRGEIEHLPVNDTRLADAKLVAAGGDASIEGTGYDPHRLLIGDDRIYLTVINGGPEEIRAYDFSGQKLGEVPVPKVASVSSLVSVGGDAFLYSAETYTTPSAWFRYDGKSAPVALPFKTEIEVDLSGISVTRAFATSKDGTKVPLTILAPKGTPNDGTHPALLTGYGGFAISSAPHFLGRFAQLWFEQGGVFAEGNIRGGAEYGEAWHTGGMLTMKQNVFDDFAACAQYLIDQHYTSPAHLAIEGGSNGGLLMGAMITQHPEMFRVVLSEVGIYDMLRTELDPNGSFNITEYGTVKEPAQFRALYAYSPYHHVRQGARYPAVFFATGDNDHRVNPAHSRKMTAALQAATTSGYPILLRTSSNAGHGMSTNMDEALEESADIYSFLFSQMGLQAKIPAN